LNEVGRSDVALIEEWERALPAEDQAVIAAFADADQRADLAGSSAAKSTNTRSEVNVRG
jgi:hypothetical protein